MARPEKALPQNVYTYRYIATIATPKRETRHIAPHLRAKLSSASLPRIATRQHLGAGVCYLYADVSIKCDAVELSNFIDGHRDQVIGYSFGPEYLLEPDTPTYDSETGDAIDA